jgi:hypothetical protein
MILCEELAVQQEENCLQQEENCAQHQLMNVMVMDMINKNNEANINSTPHQSPMNN